MQEVIESTEAATADIDHKDTSEPTPVWKTHAFAMIRKFMKIKLA